MDAKNLTVYKVEGTELHRHFKGQMEAQPCYVELDCDRGILYATYNSEIGSAVPMSVYHGHAQRWGIACLKGPAANKLLEKIKPLAERVIAGYERVWNGNNYVAKFADDAAEAIDKIEGLCRDAGGDVDDLVMVYNAGDWFENSIHRYDEDGKPCSYAFDDR